MKCMSAERNATERESEGSDGNAIAPLKEESPIALKKSAADVIDGYYKRRYNMYKEMYENGNAARQFE